MKLFLALAAASLFVVLLFVAGPSLGSAVSAADDSSKVQPKQTTLAKDSQSDKYGEVAFNHETHSLKNYMPDGKSVITCVYCHHTDQPKSAMTPPYSTSERDAVLTTDNLNDPKSGPVKTCRSCHLQVGDDSKPIPTGTDKTTGKTVKLTNDNAYHINCNTCHDRALAARPELKAKGLPGTNDCGKCHKLIG